MPTASTIPNSAPSPADSGIAGGLERGEHEDRGLDALAQDGKEGHGHQCPRAARGGGGGAGTQVGSERGACRRIHTIMNVTMPTATAATTVSSCSCWRWGSV